MRRRLPVINRGSDVNCGHVIRLVRGSKVPMIHLDHGVTLALKLLIIND